MKYQEEIYEYLRKIPKGKVVTYGQIGEFLGNKNLARHVGNVLNKNHDGNKNPCYKVVNEKGQLSESYAFGGIEAQKNRLCNDGIGVTNYKVNLKKYKMQEK